MWVIRHSFCRFSLNRHTNRKTTKRTKNRTTKRLKRKHNIRENLHFSSLFLFDLLRIESALRNASQNAHLKIINGKYEKKKKEKKTLLTLQTMQDILFFLNKKFFVMKYFPCSFLCFFFIFRKDVTTSGVPKHDKMNQMSFSFSPFFFFFIFFDFLFFVNFVNKQKTQTSTPRFIKLLIRFYYYQTFLFLPSILFLSQVLNRKHVSIFMERS